ncbi:MAG: hypothetical protein CM1200mP35_02560 [Chloroflexota bacterium]|nr:MAG: hypothetical protein CM1200mP35_02560 [Chloroflexota bacterium]
MCEVWITRSCVRCILLPIVAPVSKKRGTCWLTELVFATSATNDNPFFPLQKFISIEYLELNNPHDPFHVKTQGSRIGRLYKLNLYLPEIDEGIFATPARSPPPICTPPNFCTYHLCVTQNRLPNNQHVLCDPLSPRI